MGAPDRGPPWSAFPVGSFWLGRTTVSILSCLPILQSHPELFSQDEAHLSMYVLYSLGSQAGQGTVATRPHFANEIIEDI